MSPFLPVSVSLSLSLSLPFLTFLTLFLSLRLMVNTSMHPCIHPPIKPSINRSISDHSEILTSTLRKQIFVSFLNMNLLIPWRIEEAPNPRPD